VAKEFFKAQYKVEADHFSEFRQRARIGAERAANTIARRAQRTAKAEMTAVRTGETRRKISADVVRGSDGVIYVAVKGGTWYAHFTDRGTVSGVRALYFLEKGLAAGADFAIRDLREVLPK
jgi:HK97 gp10 family phage protein